MPETDAEKKQDLAKAQSITCDRSPHLLLTNYQQGTVCYWQGSSDVERGISWRTTQGASLFRYSFKKVTYVTFSESQSCLKGHMG